MPSDSQPSLTSLYIKRPLLFSASGWTERKVGMKCSRSVKKSTINLQTVMKKRKTVKSSLEIKAAAGSHEMKGEEIVDESEAAASLTLSDEGGIAMSKLVNVDGLLVFLLRLELQKLGGRTRAWRRRGSKWDNGLCSGRPFVQRAKGSKEWSCGL